MRLSSVVNGARQLSLAMRLTVAGTAVTLGAGAATAAVVAGGPAGHGAPRLSTSMTAAGGPAGAGGPAASAARTAAAHPAEAVTLITGDKIQLDPQGGSATPAGGGASQDFTQFSFGGDQYAVPDEAVPYLGSVLDPRLFDVSYLARAHLGAGKAAIPVTLTYHGAKVPAVPGMRVTKTQAGTATGSISPGQGSQLAALLAAHWRAGPASLTGLGRLSLAPPSSAPPLPASPFTAGAGALTSSGNGSAGLPYHRLTLKLIGPDGKPATAGIGFLMNVQSSALAAVKVDSLIGDVISFSVPAGTYSIAFNVLTPHQGTSRGYDSALVVKPQLALTGDQTVTMDARTTVPYQAQLSGTTAPAARLDVLRYERADASGTAPLESFGLFATAGDGIIPTNMSATPTAPVTQGTLAFTEIAELKGSASDPTYTLLFPSDGKIPSSLSHQVPVADLTTLHNTIYDTANSACPAHTLGFNVTQPWSDTPAIQAQYAVPTGARTDYVYDADPSLDRWQSYATASADGDCYRFYSSDPVQVRPGGVISQDYGKGPFVPSPAAAQPEDFLVGSATWDKTVRVCVACRQGDLASVTIPTFADSGQHYATESVMWRSAQISSVLRFYRNGSLAVTSDASCNTNVGANQEIKCDLAPAGLVLPMPRAAADYRLDWQETGSGTGSVSTSWTFHSSAADPITRLPSGENCQPAPAATCSLLPLLFPGYDLPLNTTSQATAGAPLTFGLTVASQQGAPAPAGVTVSVAASFDDGKTWSTPVDAKQAGGNRFSVTIDQPQLSATTGFGSLRVTARDAAGDTVTQTIIQAYGLTS